MKIKERVYDQVYGSKEISYGRSRGPTGTLYRGLQRYEVTRYKATYDLLPLQGGRLLDVGCGDGKFLLVARRKFEECYGVDVSLARIRQAKKSLHGRVHQDGFHFLKCDVDEGLPFDNSFFDCVTCVAVLEHVINPPRVIGEIHRVLKRNGILIAQVPNFAWLPCRISLLLGRLPTTGGVYLGADWEHLHNFTKSIITQLLAWKGFKIELASSSGVFARLRNWWLSALGGDIVVRARKA
jgi:ubiquinone/menaquinone biosynthesis C-methylase UbiE